MKKRNRNCKKNLESRIAQITALSVRVKQQGKHDVYVRYSSIYDGFEVDIFIGGYKNKFPGNYNWCLWLNSSRSIFKSLSQIRAKLNSLLAEGRR